MWWHPLLVRLLEWRLRGSCEVQPEVNLGHMPLRLDILLIRRLGIALPDEALRDISAICRRLNAYTLIEFKSSSDTLVRGDWNKLLGCSHLFIAQSEEGHRRADLTLMLLAPRLTEAFHEELRQSDYVIVEEEPGIHRIDRGVFRAYVMETDQVAGLREPMLTLFSRQFIKHPGEWADLLKEEHSDMLYFVMQQIVQFRRELPQFEVNHMTEYMNQTIEEMEAAFLDALPLERRLRGISREEILKRYTAEEILKGYTAEEILNRYSPEERLRGLGEEDRARLRKLLDENPSSE